MSKSRTAAATQQRRANALARRIKAAIELLCANGYHVTTSTTQEKP